MQLRGAFDGVVAEGQTRSDRGGSSDIAAALATDLLREGARVTLAGRDIEKTAVAAKAIGDAVRPVALDLSDEGSIQAAADQVRAAGRLDHLVSVAAERASGPVVSVERRALLAAFDTKVLGPILLAKHFAPMIAEEGSVLFFSGLGAWRPSPGGVAMAATNGSVSALASALAVELAPTRVNAISPGVINTSAWNTAVPDKHELFQRVAAVTPVLELLPDGFSRARGAPGIPARAGGAVFSSIDSTAAPSGGSR
ncbi:SDR family oxidoreductase [Streptomyces sp. NPDC050704]|uniref:SDR family oxidoreductase n=1 Tax=Streptomyces sp. NPDC050704 TaxID=3157219 RepID=UPI00342BB87F